MPAETAEELADLRARLRQLLRQAQHNEQILRRNHALELRLLGSESLRELLDGVLDVYRRSTRLDALSVVLLDPEFELRRLLAAQPGGDGTLPGLIMVEDGRALNEAFGPGRTPYLGPPLAGRHGELFAGVPPASAAVLPLVRRGQLIGALALGSHQSSRFEAGLGTDFLERIAAIVAVSLENVVNAERLKQLGLTDPLTGVHNRRYLESRLLEEAGRALRGGFPLACLFLDVDHFKRVNDGHGHLVGDWVLREVAARIKSQLRLSDALARYGGEEFAALLVQTDDEAALGIAERIRRAVADAPFPLVDGSGLPVTISIGVATLREQGPGQSAEAAARQLVDDADKAVYRAKEAGRNRVMLPDSGGLAQEASRAALVTDRRDGRGGSA